jgi:AraC family ethanolamine operon transcriptional activator
MDATLYALCAVGRVRRVGSAHRIDSRHVVHACLDYADLVQRIPSLGELCPAANVSERRLRDAFTDEFDLPPSRFFRAWALNAAHRRLLGSEPRGESVTDVAASLGLWHLGRFAEQYRTIYGENPSATLRAHRQGEPPAALRAVGESLRRA